MTKAITRCIEKLLAPGKDQQRWRRTATAINLITELEPEELLEIAEYAIALGKLKRLAQGRKEG